MIDRFARPDMTKIWSEDHKFKTWLDVEITATEGQEEIGIVPKGTTKHIRDTAKFDIKRIDEIEQSVRHDVIAFLTNVSEHTGDQGRFLHLGMTSSDMIDTAMAVRLQQSVDLIIAGVDQFLSALKTRIIEHRATLCMGRSHGIHAEPMTFGLKLAQHYAAFVRTRDRLQLARAEVSTCAISGAVGTFSSIDPRVEKYVAGKLGLTVEPVSTQIIPRDRYAMLMSVLSVMAGSIENLATEIRHLQRTEVREVEESFTKGQKGSSAMPHKRNPILTENLTGLSRLMRGYLTPVLETIPMWHERDISNSAVERVALPDALILADFAIHRLTRVVENLTVYPDRMMENIESLNGLIFSQSVLLALVDKGLSREEAYALTQETAMKVWAGAGDFKSLLQENTAVMDKLSSTDLDQIFDLTRYTKNIDQVIDRVLALG